jgi:hypothetical protein
MNFFYYIFVCKKNSKEPTIKNEFRKIHGVKALSKESIIEAITQKIDGTRFRIWVIGVTDKPQEARQLYEICGMQTDCWSHWRARSEKDLNEIKEYFLVQGMKQGIESDSEARCLYIF